MDNHWTSKLAVDNQLNSEDVDRFLRGLGIDVSESVVRQVVLTLRKETRGSLYSLYTYGSTLKGRSRTPICGKGTVYKIKRLFEQGELEPYVAFVIAKKTDDTPQTRQERGLAGNELSGSPAGFAGPEQQTNRASPDSTISGRHLDLQGLLARVGSMMIGPGFPSNRSQALSWVVMVRLENSDEVPLSFGDFYLHIDGREYGQEVRHSFPHVGDSTYGSNGGIPRAEDALDKLLSLTAEKPVVEGALRFNDSMPFDAAEVVRVSLSAKGTGRYRDAAIKWDLGVSPGGLKLGDLESVP